jgi:hypothetical protein
VRLEIVAIIIRCANFFLQEARRGRLPWAAYNIEQIGEIDKGVGLAAQIV